MRTITMNCYRVLTNDQQAQAIYTDERETGRRYIGSYMISHDLAVQRHGQTFTGEGGDSYYWEAAYPCLLTAPQMKQPAGYLQGITRRLGGEGGRR